MITKIIIVAWTLFMAYCFLAGAHNVIESYHGEPVSGYAMLLGIVMYSFLWGLVVVPTALIGMLFKRARKA
jgi:hypothetical protein